MQTTVLPHTEHGNGFPVLLGSSYLWDATMWAPQVDLLARRYRIILPALPGHGNDLALPTTIRTPADLASEVGRLIDSLDIDHYAVVGLSVGGMWAAELALQQPQRVRSLVLMGTSLAKSVAASS